MSRSRSKPNVFFFLLLNKVGRTNTRRDRFCPPTMRRRIGDRWKVEQRVALLIRRDIRRFHDRLELWNAFNCRKYSALRNKSVTVQPAVCARRLRIGRSANSALDPHNDFGFCNSNLHSSGASQRLLWLAMPTSLGAILIFSLWTSAFAELQTPTDDGGGRIPRIWRIKTIARVVFYPIRIYWPQWRWWLTRLMDWPYCLQ